MNSENRSTKSGVLFLLVVLIYSSIVSCKTQQTAQEPMEIRVTDTVYVEAPKNVATGDLDSDDSLPKYKNTFERRADLLHTHLEVSFDFEKKAVIGKAHLDFTPLFYSIDRLVLDAKSFDINQVMVDSSIADFEYQDDQINIELGNKFERGDTFSVQIDYVANPYREAAGGSDAILSDRGLYFIDPVDANKLKPTQIWTQGETESNSKWFPTIDKPNERCTQRIDVTVPNAFKTLSNGILTTSMDHKNNTRTDIWVMDQPHAPYLFMLAIGEFHRAEDVWKSIPLEYYVEKEYADHAPNIFGHTPEMMTYFSEILDYPYPWKKYSQVVVRDYVSGAMENTTASLFGQFLQKPSGDLVDNGNDKIVAHELFHHWFGDLVTCESWSNLTLNEGFANYSEYLWLSHQYGTDEGEVHRYSEMQAYFNQAAQNAHPLIDFHYENREDMFDAHSYNKGGLVLHMLRDIVGDEAFFASLNRYLHNMAYKAAEVHDLRLAFETVTGLDLNWFFNQWFLSEGHPIIDMQYSWMAESSKVIVDIRQTQIEKGWPVFTIPTNLQVITKDGKTLNFDILINKENHQFTFDAVGQPELVLLDPDRIQLFERLNSPEPSLVLYDNASSVWDRLKAMEALSTLTGEEKEMLVSRGLLDQAWQVRSRTINRAPELVQDKLEDISLKDPNANVRLRAVENIENINKDHIEKLMTDKSTLVVAAAADRLYKIDSIAGIRWAEKNENSISQALLQAVASNFAAANVPNKNEFFINASDKMGVDVMFPFYVTWSEYLVKSEAETIKQQLNTWLEALENDDTDIYTKYAILSTIQTLSGNIESDNYADEDYKEIQGLIKKLGMKAMVLFSQFQ